MRHYGYMKMEKAFPGVRFSADVVEDAVKRIAIADSVGQSGGLLRVTRGNETWTLDTLAEFCSELRNEHTDHHLEIRGMDTELSVQGFTRATLVGVTAPDRVTIAETMSIFERKVNDCRLPEPPAPPERKPRIFIGHGRSPEWRDLKDHLADKHGLDVAAFEVGERSGHSIGEILSRALDEASFAVMVMTGEDDTKDGSVRARQNVVHETGLFQGRLGFSKVIVVVERGVEMYSNLAGVQEVRYEKGNIREALGDVLAAIRREFSTEP